FSKIIFLNGFEIFRSILFPCIVLVCFLVQLIPAPVFSQTANINDLTGKEKKNTIYSIIKLLNNNYVFPDVASEMEKYLLKQMKDGAYDKVDNPISFGESLTKDLQQVSKDKHLRVNFSPENAKMLKDRKMILDENDEKIMRERMRYDNYGFDKVERLNGNIGYIDLRSFAPSKYSADVIAAAIDFISNTDAVIIDLRQNGGGDPSGVQMLCSYFFDTTKVHLNDLYFRPENKTDQYWTLKEVQGKRMPGVDLYLLTSKFTFSGAEEFAYDLQCQKRATIVGETTGGGAHPGDIYYVDDNFVMFLPTGNAINPVTKTNWEGTGVKPDVEISQEKALDKARLMAIEKIANTKTDPVLKQELTDQITILKALLDPIVIDEGTMQTYTGTYEDRMISFDSGALYYQRAGRPKFQMIPLSTDVFGFRELDFFKLRFDRDSGGKITGLTGIYNDGHTDKSVKN
ncbi:MAG: S41 family peptidase, partial [Ignavibacteria bacterium]